MTAQDAQHLEPEKAQSLFAALKEAQDTVRSYDTKAQIVGVGYIFAFNIIQTFASSAPSQEAVIHVAPFRFLVVWLLVFVPIIMFARVLYPSRASMSTSVRHAFYVPNSAEMTVERFKSELADCDWLNEISAEIIKVSRLRDLKRRNFIAALWASSVSYSLMFIYVVFRGLKVATG